MSVGRMALPMKPQFREESYGFQTFVPFVPQWERDARANEQASTAALVILRCPEDAPQILAMLGLVTA